MSGTTGSVPTYDFDATTQTEILSVLCWDQDFAKRTDGLVKAEYFENDIERIFARLALDHYAKYHETPSATVWKELIKEAKGRGAIRDDQLVDVVSKLGETAKITVRSRAWLMDKIAEFASQQEITNAMVLAARTICKAADPERFAKVQKVMTDAFAVGLKTEDDDYDYFERIEERTKTRQDLASGAAPKTGITTGVPELDDALHHRGWGRKELSLLMGGAKSSKSFHLGFFSGNAVKAGYNVLFVTLENSKEVAASRFDAQFSGIGISEQLSSPVTIEAGVNAVAKTPRSGKLKIREFPTGTFKPSHLRRILDEYRTKGLIFDLITLDYADICAPDHRSESNIENSSSIYKAIRAIAQEENAALLTATQTNREGHKSAVAKAEHVAEDFGRVRISDVVIAINRTEDERSEGKARLTFAACRNQPDGVTLFCRQALDLGLAIASVDSVE